MPASDVAAPTRYGGPLTGTHARSGALDGLRGIAVLLVIAYHFHLPHSSRSFIPGGWARVDVFFVLSGYLITTLLMAEQTRTGAISLRAFYGRRLRRLGPALAVFLVGYWSLTAVLAPRWPDLARPPPGYDLPSRIMEAANVLTLSMNWAGIVHHPVTPVLRRPPDNLGPTDGTTHDHNPASACSRPGPGPPPGTLPRAAPAVAGSGRPT